MGMTMEDAKVHQTNATEANRKLGIVEYKSGEPQSEKVFEVTEGLKHLPGGLVLGPGERFHPTERQVANGSLKNKAQELSRDQYTALGSGGRKSFGVNVDLLGKVPMAPTVREAAVAAGLVTEDFVGVEPEGSEGQYTKKQVEALVVAKTSAKA